MPSEECWLKTQTACKTVQQNEGTFNANVVISNEESHKREDFSNNAILRSAQEDEIKHVIVSERETIQPIANQKQLQGEIDSLRETSCPPLVGGEFADGRRVTSQDRFVFPRPLWERVSVRGVNENNTKPLITDWIVSHTLTMTKNFTNNAILLGLNNCSPQNDCKNYVARWKNSCKIAFTLAEVLITLGIIGVVAALTLPSVITKFQQKTFTTAFKKEYSTLNNAINMIVFENDTKECYITLEIPEGGGLIYSAKDSDCNALKTNLITKLRLTKVDKYVSSYLTKSKVLEQGGVSVNSSVTYDSILRNGEFNSYLIPDGGIVSFFYAQYGGLVVDTSIVIDVNGQKGPNKWGYDVFWLTLVKTNDGLRLTDEYATLSEKGGSLPRNILLNSWSNNYKNIGHGLWQ